MESSIGPVKMFLLLMCLKKKKNSFWVIEKVAFAFKQNALKICWVRVANGSALAGLEHFHSLSNRGFGRGYRSISQS